jgi:hypothetical protein
VGDVAIALCRAGTRILKHSVRSSQIQPGEFGVSYSVMCSEFPSQSQISSTSISTQADGLPSSLHRPLWRPPRYPRYLALMVLVTSAAARVEVRFDNAIVMSKASVQTAYPKPVGYSYCLLSAGHQDKMKPITVRTKTRVPFEEN